MSITHGNGSIILPLASWWRQDIQLVRPPRLPRHLSHVAVDCGSYALALVQALEDGNPRVFVFEPTGPTAAPNSIIVNPHTLQPGEERIVADTLAGAFRQRMLPRVATAAG